MIAFTVSLNLIAAIVVCTSLWSAHKREQAAYTNSTGVLK